MQTLGGNTSSANRLTWIINCAIDKIDRSRLRQSSRKHASCECHMAPDRTLTSKRSRIILPGISRISAKQQPFDLWNGSCMLITRRDKTVCAFKFRYPRVRAFQHRRFAGKTMEQIEKNIFSRKSVSDKKFKILEHLTTRKLFSCTICLMFYGFLAPLIKCSRIFVLFAIKFPWLCDWTLLWENYDAPSTYIS